MTAAALKSIWEGKNCCKKTRKWLAFSKRLQTCPNRSYTCGVSKKDVVTGNVYEKLQFVDKRVILFFTHQLKHDQNLTLIILKSYYKIFLIHLWVGM